MHVLWVVDVMMTLVLSTEEKKNNPSNTTILSCEGIFFTNIILVYTLHTSYTCPGGGIGRHAGLRGLCLFLGVEVRVLSWAPDTRNNTL